MTRLLTPLLLLPLLITGCAQPQRMERELGDFDLTLGTSPSRSMAQGLIQPARIGAFHGGFDLTHADGWYVGGWAPSMGVRDESLLELNAYAGVFQPLDERFGYELGVIQYSFPEIDVERHQFYSGLTLNDHQLGAAVTYAADRTDGTLLLDLALANPFGLDLRVKLGTHLLEQPVMIGTRPIDAFEDWSLSLSRPWNGARLDLSYSGTSLQGAGCAAYSGQNAYCQDFWKLSLVHALF